MKRTQMATDLTRIEHTVLLNAMHDKLQLRDFSKNDHLLLRKLYYAGLWATRITFDIGADELPHAAKLASEWDYSDYPILRRNGVVINRPSAFPAAAFVDGAVVVKR